MLDRLIALVEVDGDPGLVHRLAVAIVCGLASEGDSDIFTTMLGTVCAFYRTTHELAAHADPATVAVVPFGVHDPLPAAYRATYPMCAYDPAAVDQVVGAARQAAARRRALAGVAALMITINIPRPPVPPTPYTDLVQLLVERCGTLARTVVWCADEASAAAVRGRLEARGITCRGWDPRLRVISGTASLRAYRGASLVLADTPPADDLAAVTAPIYVRTPGPAAAPRRRRSPATRTDDAWFCCYRRVFAQLGSGVCQLPSNDCAWVQQQYLAHRAGTMPAVHAKFFRNIDILVCALDYIRVKLYHGLLITPRHPGARPKRTRVC